MDSGYLVSPPSRINYFSADTSEFGRFIERDCAIEERRAADVVSGTEEAFKWTEPNLEEDGDGSDGIPEAWDIDSSPNATCFEFIEANGIDFLDNGQMITVAKQNSAHSVWIVSMLSDDNQHRMRPFVLTEEDRIRTKGASMVRVHHPKPQHIAEYPKLNAMCPQQRQTVGVGLVWIVVRNMVYRYYQNGTYYDTYVGNQGWIPIKDIAFGGIIPYTLTECRVEIVERALQETPAFAYSEDGTCSALRRINDTLAYQYLGCTGTQNKTWYSPALFFGQTGITTAYYYHPRSLHTHYIKKSAGFCGMK